MRKILYIIGQVWRSLCFAVDSVVINKLRTALSLFGITIGIFAIISIFTVIDSLEAGIRESVDAIGSDVLYVEKWPWVPEEGNEYKWWKYASRPVPSYSEFQQITAATPDAEATAMACYFRRNARVGSRSTNIRISGVTHDFDQMRKLEFDQGRYFTPYESAHGARVAVIGARLAADLFPDVDPLGQFVTIGGSKTEIVGVLVKDGTAMMGGSFDNQAIIPFRFSTTMVDPRWTSPGILVKAKKGIDSQDFIEQTRASIRQIRRLKPGAEDNFAINESSALNRQLDPIFSMINLGGGLIGIFAILVGGFGVANIMFVSVRERTSQIGIEKALGARPYFILLQFTFEAILLSIVGGAVGLLLIFIGASAVTAASGFQITLSIGNITLGLLISSIVGAVAGIFPAYTAARMDPVKAIFKT